MNLLQDLLSLRTQQQEEPKPIQEARGGSVGDAIEKWMDREKAWSMEGPSGVRKFEKLIGVLGYRSMDDFLEDNSGAMQAMVEWLSDQRNSEWLEALGGGEEDDEDDDK